MTRLTIDQVRVGDRVVCVNDDLWGAPRIRAGEVYEIESFGWEGHVHLRGQNKSPKSGWNINRFIPAPAPPAPSPPGVTDVQPTLPQEWWS